MATVEAKVVKLPAFDGTHDGFMMWWLKFKAYARVQKFVQALAPGPAGDPELPATEGAARSTTAATAALEVEALARNTVARIPPSTSPKSDSLPVGKNS
jgi:hypothetical protein